MSVPKQIIEAVKTIRAKITPLKHNEENKHGGYGYVSIDKYYETVAKIATEAGLVWSAKEESFDLIPNQGKEKNRTYVKATISYSVHSGEHTAENYMRISILTPIDGPQTTGQIFSYADKIFMRVSFCVVTGEQDADAAPQEPMVSTHTPDPILEPPTKQHLVGGDTVGRDGQGNPLQANNDGEVLELPPIQAAVAPKFKDGLPLIDTKKIERTEAGEKSVAIMIEIFKVFLPNIKAKAKLNDWYAENLAAIEKGDQVVKGTKSIIAGLFKARMDAILKPKPEAATKDPLDL